MNRYEFEGKNCTVYVNERFGEIRTVTDENGERRYVGIDIAECMGFEAPHKAVKRSNIPGKMVKVPWVSGNRHGETNARCFNKKEADKFIRNGMLPPKGFKEWFSKEVAIDEAIDICKTEMWRSESSMLEKKFVDDAAGMSKLFTRVDEIILEMLMLKKELAGKLEK